MCVNMPPPSQANHHSVHALQLERQNGNALTDQPLDAMYILQFTYCRSVTECDLHSSQSKST